MTKSEILTKAIAIAKRKGFDISDDFFVEVPVETWLQENQDLYFSLIFCHDFAFCFFGNDSLVIGDLEDEAEDVDLLELENPIGFLMANRKNIRIPLWQYHLLQMMLCKDPLMYLPKFIQDYEQAELN